jgi:GR25 family glycosyltransferase involved in LPS biosynthesis
MSSCLEYIDAILYINLDHRSDRMEHVLQEIKKIDPTLSKSHRINAEYVPDHGALGCTKSHIKALQRFMKHPKWKNCLILEDDFTFVSNSVEEINRQIVDLFQESPTYDVLMLAHGILKFSMEPTSSSFIHRILSAQTTSGYILHRDYLPTLLHNFQESCQNLETNGKSSEGCLDIHWKRLQPQGKWFTYYTRIGYQYESYSDVEKFVANYKC